MKKRHNYIVYLTTILLLFSCSQKEQTSNEIDYFGQNPPGLTPEIFAPGVVSTRYHEHSAPNFSPDGKEMVYTLSCDPDHIIMYTRHLNGKWSIPEPADFSGKYSDDAHVWSNDGKKMYFRSKRPVKNDTTINIYRNWIVSKTETGWGNPTLNNFSAYSFTKTGTNYFYEKSENGDWDIYCSKPVDNFLKNENPGKNINSENTDATPFIAPDESYLIFASQGRDDAVGIMDLYISFKKEEGNWTRAKNLGEPVNIPGHISRFPRVSPDGKYLFYWCNIKNDQLDNGQLSTVEEAVRSYNPWRPENGKDGDIYWVSIKIIDKYRPVK